MAAANEDGKGCWDYGCLSMSAADISRAELASQDEANDSLQLWPLEKSLTYQPSNNWPTKELGYY